MGLLEIPKRKTLDEWNAKRFEFKAVGPDDAGVSENGAKHLRKLGQMSREEKKPVAAAFDFEAIKIYAGKVLREHVEKTGAKILIDGNFKAVFDGLILYFARSENSPYPLNKGIFLHGDGGTGKSTLMNVMRDVFMPYSGKAFNICRVPELITRVKNTQGDVLSPQYVGRVCFDDIAFSNPFAQNYGNEINVIAEIINTRYNHFLTNGKITHFVSNFDIDLLQCCRDNRDREYFNELIRSRLKKICTEIEVTGCDKRLI
jgi:hypothetical protein